MGNTIKVPWISYNYINYSATAHIFAEFLYTLWNSITVWYDIESKRKICNAGKEPRHFSFWVRRNATNTKPKHIKFLFCSIDVRSVCIYPLMQESRLQSSPSRKPSPQLWRPPPPPPACSWGRGLLLGGTPNPETPPRRFGNIWYLRKKKIMTIKQQYHYGTKTLIILNLSLSFSYRFINY